MRELWGETMSELVKYDRVANTTWDIWKRPDGYSRDQVQLAVLMDIRGELKKLNNLLSCTNFLGIPHSLRMIEKNTKKPTRRRDARGEAPPPGRHVGRNLGSARTRVSG